MVHPTTKRKKKLIAQKVYIRLPDHIHQNVMTIYSKPKVCSIPPFLIMLRNVYANNACAAAIYAKLILLRPLSLYQRPINSIIHPENHQNIEIIPKDPFLLDKVIILC